MTCVVRLHASLNLSDPSKRVRGCKPSGTSYPQRRWVPHTWKDPMELNRNERDFLMHCMELFADGCETVKFLTYDETEVLMDYDQINDLYFRIQDSEVS